MARNLVEKRTLQILTGFLIVSLFLESWPISLGLILGGLLSLLNFRWLWWIIVKIILENRKLQGIQIVAKFFCLAGAIFFLLRFAKINGLAFLVGISAFVAALISVAIQKSFLENRNKEV